jgi:predicted SAM-dependent methyltransferase
VTAVTTASPLGPVPPSAPSSPNRNHYLLGELDLLALRGIEIAPLNRAIVAKTAGDVIYVDRLSHAELCQVHAGSPFFKQEDILRVDVALGDRSIGKAAPAGRSFDYVVASHVVEHIPDLVTWFADLGSLLCPLGTMRLAVPDRHFTFDYVRRESKTSEVLPAHVLKAVSPTPQMMLDHYLNVRAVDFIAAWNGPLDPAKLTRFHTPEFAIEQARRAVSEHLYPEVHCSTFTPASFAEVFGDLAEFGLLGFECQSLIPARPSTFEFFVTMAKCSDRERAVSSWRNAAGGSASVITETAPSNARSKRGEDAASPQDDCRFLDLTCTGRRNADFDCDTNA